MQVWIVDDEEHLVRGLRVALEREGHDVTAFHSLSALRAGLSEQMPPHVTLLDVRLPDGDGLDALPHILQAAPWVRVIVMTAFGDSSTVVRSIREGAWNFLDKPFPLEAVKNMVRRAGEALHLSRRVESLSREQTQQLIGSSAALERVWSFLHKVAPHQDVNVLLQGESGAGKEVVARLLHDMAGCSGEFVAINCTAIPESLLEAELFGHKRGAYTGAEQDKEGLISLAGKGTLFLDEIADIPMELQGKLLRFLDSRTYRPLGGMKESRVALRVVCATAGSLEQRVQKGAFREDLYYRISLLPLTIPPLRERGRDVLELARYFRDFFCDKRGRKPFAFTPEVEDVLLSHPWPGNVREMRNLIERIAILKDVEDQFVRLSDLPPDMLEGLPDTRNPGKEDRDVSLVDRVDRYERDLIEGALNGSGGNRTQAAKKLGISRYALLRRLQKYGFA
ncbi:MAG: sigma-54 dependent transcriptional regulator [Synergistales bacterium]|nr:sigma-54 dependent transcriptional regulator [Synergistales bacterium]